MSIGELDRHELEELMEQIGLLEPLDNFFAQENVQGFFKQSNILFKERVLKLLESQPARIKETVEEIKEMILEGGYEEFVDDVRLSCISFFVEAIKEIQDNAGGDEHITRFIYSMSKAIQNQSFTLTFADIANDVVELYMNDINETLRTANIQIQLMELFSKTKT